MQIVAPRHVLDTQYCIMAVHRKSSDTQLTHCQAGIGLGNRQEGASS